MSPQFVDFNADGHLDIVCGIFDGSPHVALGDGEHFQQPSTILDKHGERIVLNAFWNFGKKQWDQTDRCDPQGGAPAEGHLTSAIAMDWDHDGDFDLVLGDHRNGYVYLRRNEGSNQKPAFAGKNELLMAGGKPLHDPGTIATVRSVDWNADGLLDLLVGSMGDPYGDRTGGGLNVYLGQAQAAQGKDQTTVLGAAISLIPASPKGAVGKPTRPDAGLHPEAVDVDGDGDLDLLVGGYSIWGHEPTVLTDAQTAQLAELRSEQAKMLEQTLELNRQMLKAQEGLDAEAAKQKRIELLGSDSRRELNQRRSKVLQKIHKLAPPNQRVSFVWLYENLTKHSAGAPPR